MAKSINLLNQRINFFTVIEQLPSGRYGQRWKCKCDCGKIVEHYSSTLLRNRTKSCGCFNLSEKKSRPSSLIPYRFWDKFLRLAKRRQIAVLVSAKDIEEKFLQQNKRCALSGVEISLPSSASRLPEDNCSVSIDRIDSSLPYTKDNIQLVHKQVNMMKQHYSQESFLRFCKLITNHQKARANKPEPVV